MTPTSIHPFSQEEMMAYLDGELSPERALAAARHLEECRECRELVEEMRRVSSALTNWIVEPKAASLPPAAAQTKSKPRWAGWKIAGLVLSSAAAVLAIVFVNVYRPAEGVAVGTAAQSETPRVEQRAALQRMAPHASMKTAAEPALEASSAARAARQSMPFMLSAPAPVAAPAQSPSQPGPEVVRTAQLTMISRNLIQSGSPSTRSLPAPKATRPASEFTNEANAGRTMDTTIRIPAARLETVLQSLRGLGHVDAESQQGEDVTQRDVDLNARLANLQTAETRLLQILRERTGKLADVLQVEEAIDSTRGEIEVAKAEQHRLSNQVAFASIRLRVVEQYRAALNTNGNSTAIRLRNALVEGYESVLAFLLGVVEFSLQVGPTLAVILGLAFFPARWLWRRRSSFVTGS